MLIGTVILGIFLVCTLFSPLLDTAPLAGAAVMEGAGQAVSFCLNVAGGICLWSGVMEVMERCGVSRLLSRLLRPLLGRLFPHSAREEAVFSALSENVSANLLGLGNAATPAGIRAAQGMARLKGAADELCLLVVVNTASIQLLPTTIAAVRASLGAASAFDIMPAVWISSLLSVCAGILAAAILRRVWR